LHIIFNTYLPAESGLKHFIKKTAKLLRILALNAAFAHFQLSVTSNTANVTLHSLHNMRLLGLPAFKFVIVFPDEHGLVRLRLN